MEATGNCSDSPPTSEAYFADLSLGEKIGIGVSSALCVSVIVLFVEQVYFVIKKYPTDREIKIKSLWLVGIYPMFALAALLAVYVPRAVLLCDLASSIYLAVCLFHFTSLIILYAGGIPELLQSAEVTGFSLRTPPCCCCCVCCPVISATWPNLRKLRLMVFQTSFLQPFISFLTLVLWLDEKYVQGKIAVDEAYIYLAVINAVSTLTAMYGLIILYRTSRGFLKEQNISQKFIVLQLVLIFHNLQGFIFVTLARYNLPPCSGVLSPRIRMNGIKHMVLVGEMFLLALAARCLYHRPTGQTPNTSKANIQDHPAHNGDPANIAPVPEEEAVTEQPGRALSKEDPASNPEERYRKLYDVESPPESASSDFAASNMGYEDSL